MWTPWCFFFCFKHACLVCLFELGLCLIVRSCECLCTVFHGMDIFPTTSSPPSPMRMPSVCASAVCVLFFSLVICINFDTLPFLWQSACPAGVVSMASGAASSSSADHSTPQPHQKQGGFSSIFRSVGGAIGGLIKRTTKTSVEPQQQGVQGEASATVEGSAETPKGGGRSWGGKLLRSLLASDE